MSKYYTLVGTTPVEINDVIKWAKSFKDESRRVAFDTVGNSEISTVFLGLDHSFGGNVPMLFETMVFGGELDQEMKRYPTWELAESGHRQMVERVKELLK